MWSVPAWPPRAVTRRLEAANARTAAEVVPAIARAVGAPVVHAAHCGEVESALPWSPVRYRGRYEGATTISAHQDGEDQTAEQARSGPRGRVGWPTRSGDRRQRAAALAAAPPVTTSTTTSTIRAVSTALSTQPMVSKTPT